MKKGLLLEFLLECLLGVLLLGGLWTCGGRGEEEVADSVIDSTALVVDTIPNTLLALPDSTNDRVHYLLSSDRKVLVESQIIDNGTKELKATNRCLFVDSLGRVDTICDFFSCDGKSYWVTRLFTVQCRNGKKYYLASCFDRKQGDNCYGELIAFAPDSNSLRRVSIVDGSYPVAKDDIASYFSYHKNAYPMALYPFVLRCGATYSEMTHVLATYVGQEPTDRYAVYQFDGSKFVLKNANAPRQGLNKYLKDYEELECEFVTAKYRVRIDRMDNTDTAFRYAAWKDCKAHGAKPDLVLYGGTYSKANDCYRFDNKGYIYSVSDVHRNDTIRLQVHKDNKLLVNEHAVK